MKTISQNIYTFSELSEEAKERIETVRDENGEYETTIEGLLDIV